MKLSGGPVSKYRVKVSIPGRPEYILVSGAPTYLGHRSFLFDQSLRWWQLADLRSKVEFLQVDPDTQPIQLLAGEQDW